MALVGFEPG